MSRLAELLPFHAGYETVASYFSRLAAACGYENARAFAFHLQLQFQGIVAGREKDLETFAAVLDRPRSSLSAGVILLGEVRTCAVDLRSCPECGIS